MLGLTFLFPAILYAAGAAAAPVIIHLILRTKPRRIVFPALRFVKKTHNANISKLRLKHLLLLLMRMAMIAGLAYLIAQWQIPAWTTEVKDTSPVLAVLVIDNSASTSAKQAGQTLLAKEKAMAVQLIEQMPPGSKVALLDIAGQAGGEFLVDRKLLAQQVADVPAEFGSQSLPPAIAKAVKLLTGNDMSPKELYVLTDMTEPAWGDLKAKWTHPDIRTTILDCGLGQDSNIGLGEIKLGAAIAPVGVPVALETTITGSTLGGDVIVQAELDGKPVDQRTVSVKPGIPSSLELPVRAAREGLLQGKITIQHTDPLEVDNVRYFTLEARRLPQMLFVADKTTDPTYALMRAAVSPPAGRSWVQPGTITAEPLTPERLAKVSVVMLADMPALTDPEWRALGKFVNEGGHLWVVAGPLMSVAAYNSNLAQQLMPVSLKALEEAPKGVAWKAPKDDEPFLEPFKSPDNGLLSDVLCKLRFTIQATPSDAKVILSYADDVPAVVRRPLGEGSVLFWNFTPDPAHFFASGYTQFAVLTQHTIRQIVGDQGSPSSFHYGDEAVVPLPKSMKNPIVTLRRPDSQADEPVTPDFRRGVLALRADRLGHWLVRVTEGDRKIEKGFSVNTDPAESRLAPVDPKAVLALFPPDQVHLFKEVQQVAQQRQTVSQSLDMAVPVLLAMLLLLTGEAFFANRFYKQPSQAPDGAPVPPSPRQ